MRITTLAFRTYEEQQEALGPAVRHLSAGGLIACPTETVYGFGCALSPAPLAALAHLKRREAQRPFLLLVPDPHLPGLVWTEAARRLAARFWPGPLTLALATEPGSYPPSVCGPDRTVAVRRTGHAGVADLVRAFGAPITSTSANLAGSPPAMDAGAVTDVLESADGQADILLLDGGPLLASPPSTIVDCSSDPPRVVRAGAVALELLRTVVHDIEA